MKMTKSAFLIGLFLCCHTPISAQINTPKLSPHCVITQELGFNEITVDYCRPSVRNRVIFGDLVPYGSIWRTGANASTKLKIKEEVSFDGHEVPAGDYALYTIPGKDEWTIIIHTVTSYWGVGKEYKESDDLLRFKVKPITLGKKIETMTIEFSDFSDNNCMLEIKWENTLVKFKIESFSDKKVMSEIDEKMKGVSQATYYQSAVYYLENGKDLKLALTWIDKALENNEKFWILNHKAQILNKLGRYKEALSVAEHSLSLAKIAENEEYIKMNEKLIVELKAQIK